jgi:hypothetical protein
VVRFARLVVLLFGQISARVVIGRADAVANPTSRPNISQSVELAAELRFEKPIGAGGSDFDCVG